MKIIRNENRIKRNGQVGFWLSMIAFLLFGGSFYLVTTRREALSNQTVYYTLIAFSVGYILMQVGLYLTNRFGGVPRVDERLDASLKGLPGDYTFYHFVTPASHLLVGPGGIWALFAYRQRGLVVYERNRWRVRGGGFFQLYMTIFGQEGIGRPDLEAEGEVLAVRKLLAKTLGENEIPQVQAVLIFTNEAVEIQADDAPLPAITIKQLKEFIRKKAKEKPIGQNQLAAVKAALPQA
jgi:hypothetical protein